MKKAQHIIEQEKVNKKSFFSKRPIRIISWILSLAFLMLSVIYSLNLLHHGYHGYREYRDLFDYINYYNMLLAFPIMVFCPLCVVSFLSQKLKKKCNKRTKCNRTKNN